MHPAHIGLREANAQLLPHNDSRLNPQQQNLVSRANTWDLELKLAEKKEKRFDSKMMRHGTLLRIQYVIRSELKDKLTLYPLPSGVILYTMMCSNVY